MTQEFKPGRFCGAVWVLANIFLACSSQEGEHPNPQTADAGADTGGSSGAASGGSGGTTGQGATAGTMGSSGESVGGSHGAGAASNGGAGGNATDFWCDVTDADVCRCRSGPKPNATATRSCAASDCCVRTGAGDNRSCACGKPDSLFKCEDVKNYVGGAVIVPSCPF